MAGAATFGDLTWGVVQPGDTTLEAAAFGPFTGHRIFAGAPQPSTGTQGLPPVVAAGRVYLNAGDRIVCFALPSAASAPAALTSP